MPQLIPVDHDPFADDPVIAPPSNPATPPEAVSNWVRGIASHLASIPQRAFESSENLRQGGDYDPAPVMDAAGLVTLGAGAIPAEADALRMGIRAYHGSPHDFDAFDLSKIGTGEGAQSYGHGLYFAENEGVAKSYRDALAQRKAAPSLTDDLGRLQIAGEPLKKKFDIDNMPEFVQLANSGDAAGMQSLVGNRLARWRALADDSSYQFRDYAKDKIAAYEGLAKELASGSKITTPLPPSGRMYETNINADPEQFLDWDKPLSEQPASVQNHFADKGITTDDKFRRELASGTAYESNAMRNAGIPGIKYLDQGSRLPVSDFTVWAPKVGGDEQFVVRGPGNLTHAKFDTREEANAFADKENEKVNPTTHNYVVFNDKLIDILRKYGLAGTLGPAAAAGASSQWTPVDHDPFAQ